MINAGLAVRNFDGLQQFDAEQGLWKGIGVTVNYPDDQNATDNGIAIGDVMIEGTGRVWVVTKSEVEDLAKRTFRLELKLRSRETTADDEPNLGREKTGGITTPVRGYLAVHWDSQLVSGDVSRVAAYENGLHLDEFIPPDLWNGVVDGGDLGEVDTEETGEGNG